MFIFVAHERAWGWREALPLVSSAVITKGPLLRMVIWHFLTPSYNCEPAIHELHLKNDLVFCEIWWHRGQRLTVWMGCSWDIGLPCHGTLQWKADLMQRFQSLTEFHINRCRQWVNLKRHAGQIANMSHICLELGCSLWLTECSCSCLPSSVYC